MRLQERAQKFTELQQQREQVLRAGGDPSRVDAAILQWKAEGGQPSPGPVSPPPTETPTPPPKSDVPDEQRIADLADRVSKGDKGAAQEMSDIGRLTDAVAASKKENGDRPSPFQTDIGGGGQERTPFDPGLGRDFSAPSINPPPVGAEAPTSQGGGGGPDLQFEEEPGGVRGWLGKNKDALIAGGLGAGISGLAQLIQGGHAGGKAMQSFTEGYMPTLRAEQQAELTRRQAGWESAFEDSKSLPPEVQGDPKFAPLVEAAYALQKDMEDGKIDNEKNMSNWLTQKAKFSGEVSEFMQGVQLERKADEARSQWEISQKLIDERVQMLQQQLTDAMLRPEQRRDIENQLLALRQEGESLRMKSEALRLQVEQAKATQTHREAVLQQGERRLGQGDKSLQLQEQRLSQMGGAGGGRAGWGALQAAGGVHAAQTPSELDPGRPMDQGLAMQHRFVTDPQLQQYIFSKLPEGTLGEENGQPVINIGGQTFPYTPEGLAQVFPLIAGELRGGR
jgi:hypothetical protein